MGFLRFLSKLFLLPGTLVLGALDIDIESDGGIFRSLINMIFWGTLIVICGIPFVIALNG